MKKKIKIILSVLIFCILFGGLFYVVDTTLKFKYDDGIRTMMDFYHYPDDSVDVLFLGSSHIGVNLDTVQMCNDYGIASYKLWGTSQPVWNAYFNLVEALKTQSPQIVVLETLGLTHDIDYQEYSASVKNTLGLRWSKNKLDAIRVSVDPTYRKDVYTGFSTYHSRYASLEAQDFTSYFWNYQFKSKNTTDWDAVFVGTEPVETEAAEPMGEKASLYFEKIVNLCKKKGIELVLVSAPYSIQEEERARLNTVKEYAAENQITYLDYVTNYEEIGIDFNTDFGDSAGHLNSNGIEKLTAAIGTYLRDNYDLPERYYDPYFAYEIPSEDLFCLTEPFVGDGEREFIDTKISLYDDPTYSWTLLSEIDTQCDSDEKIYFSCFDETEPYRGLLVRKAEDNQIDVICGDNYYTKLELPDKETVPLVIAKEGSQYRIYLEDTLAATVESSCDAYNGTLTIGSQRLSDNTIGKLSKVNINALEVREGAMEEEEILTWMESHQYIPTREEVEESLKKQDTGKINYVLSDSFTGDGVSSAINTGIQLYSNPEQDWTLCTELGGTDETDGVYLSCFSEDPENYRGLLIRKSDDMLQILLANGQILQQKLLDSSDIKIVIRKKKNTYWVYTDGKLLGKIKGTCDPYLGQLYVGCELDEDYNPYRYSTLTIKQLEIRKGAISEKEAMAW